MLVFCWSSLGFGPTIAVSVLEVLKTVALPQLMFFAMEVYWRYLIRSVFYSIFDTFSVIFLLRSTGIKWLLTPNIAVIACFWFSLMACFRILSFWLLFIEERSSYWINSLTGSFDFFLNYHFYVAFPLFLRLLGIIQLLLKNILFLDIPLPISFWFIDLRMIAVFHPPMTLITLHTRWTLWCLDGLYFILEVPMWTFLRFVVIHCRFPSKILNIVSIGTLSSIMAA